MDIVSLRVQRLVEGEGEVKEYTAQDEVEHAIQRKCEICLSLAHSAPIMTTLLRKRLWFLSDKPLARSIIMGTYEIPSDMDPPTKLIYIAVSCLRLQTPIDCIPHPYWMYKKYLSTLRCCGWAYGCTFALLRPYRLGWILVKLGLAKYKWCCGVMVEAANLQRLHPPIMAYICKVF